jgi:hypothetical protein
MAGSEHRVDIPAGTAVDQDVPEDLAAGMARTHAAEVLNRRRDVERALALRHLQSLADHGASVAGLSARELQALLGLL